MTKGVMMSSQRPGVFGRELTPFLAVLFASSAFVFATAWIAPLNGEDYGLSPPFAARGLNVWAEIIRHSRNQSAGWNARLGEQLSIFWLALPKICFIVVDTFCFLLLTAIVAALAMAPVFTPPRFLKAWAVSALLTYALWPRLEFFFWETVSAGYLQPLLCSLVILLPFLMEGGGRFLSRNNLAFFGLILTAFLAGASFENYGPALLLLMVAAMFADYRSGQPIGKLASISAVYTLGWVALMTAPSTHRRIAYYRTAMHVPPLSFHYLVGRVVDVARVFTTSGARLFAACIVLTLIARSYNQKSEGRGKIILLLWAGLVTVAGAVAAPYTEARAFALVWVAALVYSTRFLDAGRIPKALRLAYLVFALTFAGWRALFAMREYKTFADAINQRDAFIQARVNTPSCHSGLPISLVSFRASPNILNNREIWVGDSINQVSEYYGCRLVVQHELRSFPSGLGR